MSIRTRIETTDRRLGSPFARTVRRTRGVGGIVAIEEGLRRLDFEVDRRQRQWRHGKSVDATSGDSQALAALRSDGVAVLRETADGDWLLALRLEHEAELDSGAHLTRVADDSVRFPGNRSEARIFILEEDLKRGQESYRYRTNYAAVAEPILRCSIATRLALDQRFLALTATYLGCPPSIGGVNLRRSFRNDLPDLIRCMFIQIETAHAF